MGSPRLGALRLAGSQRSAHRWAGRGRIPLMEHPGLQLDRREYRVCVGIRGCRQNVSAPPGEGEIGAKGRGGHLARAGIEQVQGICQRVRLRLWALTRWMLTARPQTGAAAVCRLDPHRGCSPSASMTSSQSRSLAPTATRPRRGSLHPHGAQGEQPATDRGAASAVRGSWGSLHLDQGRRRASFCERRCSAAARGRRGQEPLRRGTGGVSACSGHLPGTLSAGGLARSGGQVVQGIPVPRVQGEGRSDGPAPRRQDPEADQGIAPLLVVGGGAVCPRHRRRRPGVIPDLYQALPCQTGSWRRWRFPIVSPGGPWPTSSCRRPPAGRGATPMTRITSSQWRRSAPAAPGEQGDEQPGAEIPGLPLRRGLAHGQGQSRAGRESSRPACLPVLAAGRPWPPSSGARQGVADRAAETGPRRAPGLPRWPADVSSRGAEPARRTGRLRQGQRGSDARSRCPGEAVGHEQQTGGLAQLGGSGGETRPRRAPGRCPGRA